MKHTSRKMCSSEIHTFDQKQTEKPKKPLTSFFFFRFIPPNDNHAFIMIT